jgi:negative regulator of flagellin synthesis FlgM
MTVDRIGPLEPIQPSKKPGRNEQVRGGSDKSDSINISTEAMEKAERYQVIELIKSAPELDEARIVELRKKIDDPAYINDKIINATADKIIDAWFA